MNHLKKCISFFLSVSLLLAILLLDCGAVFTDQGDIQHGDAVVWCEDRGILRGYVDGSFQPDRCVTRAEFCRMLCLSMGFSGEAGQVSAFADVPDTHWAKGSIDLCYTRGIVAGMGDGTFAPSGKVTGVQAAKMLLIAMGLDPVEEGFVGADWDVFTNVKAYQMGLYDELEDLDTAEPLTREHAAQMLYNCMP